ncbi:MAG: hypothetical protein E5V90_16500 [Mesorhizobium sp.]|nr:MAG: hypothetical protein E5V90_16500 [Mesorhizobium sp.]
MQRADDCPFHAAPLSARHRLRRRNTATDLFAPLRQHLLARCADQFAGLAAIAHHPLAGNDSQTRLAHPLAGAVGMFGFAEASARDSALETRFAEQGKRARRSR